MVQICRHNSSVRIFISWNSPQRVGISNCLRRRRIVYWLFNNIDLLCSIIICIAFFLNTYPTWFWRNNNVRYRFNVHHHDFSLVNKQIHLICTRVDHRCFDWSVVGTSLGRSYFYFFLPTWANENYSWRYLRCNVITCIILRVFYNHDWLPSSRNCWLTRAANHVPYVGGRVCTTAVPAVIRGLYAIVNTTCVNTTNSL